MTAAWRQTSTTGDDTISKIGKLNFFLKISASLSITAIADTFPNASTQYMLLIIKLQGLLMTVTFGLAFKKLTVSMTRDSIQSTCHTIFKYTGPIQPS